MGTTSDKDLGYGAIVRTLRQLDGATIAVGIHEDTRADEDAEVTTAYVGAVHEYGSTDGRVPARPWLGPTIDENEAELNAMAEKIVDRVIASGGRVSLEHGLNIVGERALQLVQAKVRDSDPSWKPLTKQTKQRKAAKAGLSKEARDAFVAGDGNPLVDTAAMLNSITKKVELGGKEVG